MRLQSQGFLTDAPMPMPQDWNGIADSVQAQGDQVIEAWICRAYDALWGSPSDTPVVEPVHPLPAQDAPTLVFPMDSGTNSLELPTTGACEATVKQVVEPKFETIIESALELSLTKCSELGLKWVDRSTAEGQPASSSLANQMQSQHLPSCNGVVPNAISSCCRRSWGAMNRKRDGGTCLMSPSASCSSPIFPPHGFYAMGTALYQRYPGESLDTNSREVDACATPSLEGRCGLDSAWEPVTSPVTRRGTSFAVENEPQALALV